MPNPGVTGGNGKIGTTILILIMKLIGKITPTGTTSPTFMKTSTKLLKSVCGTIMYLVSLKTISPVNTSTGALTTQ